MSHGPPDLPIHLVPPLGGLLSTGGGHGKGLQPCFTLIREDLTERVSDTRDLTDAILRVRPRVRWCQASSRQALLPLR